MNHYPEGIIIDPIEEMGLGWKSSFGSGKAGDTISSGIEGAWTTNPIKWDNNYFENLFGYEWELVKSPAGAHQWVAKGGEGTVPDAHDPSKKHAPMMTPVNRMALLRRILDQLSPPSHDTLQLQLIPSTVLRWHRGVRKVI